MRPDKKLSAAPDFLIGSTFCVSEKKNFWTTQKIKVFLKCQQRRQKL